MKRTRLSLALLAGLALLTAASGSAVTFTKINSSPLKINVASDGSFQVFNDAVPGKGQIYPDRCDLADMGIFANIDGTLFAPDFHNHTCATATVSLGTFTAWQTLSSGSVGGDGSAESPYTVSVSLKAPGTDVTVIMNVTHVRGDNFFRIATQYFSPTPHHIDAFLGADIFLAASDFGRFLTVPDLDAVGGSDCATPPTYNILLIPLTPANRFTASGYADVWAQIGSGHLNNGGTGSSDCVDNGAAVQWLDVVQNSNAVQLLAAVSFGDIPSAANFRPFSIDVQPKFVSLLPGESATLKVTTGHNPQLGFKSSIALSPLDLPDGMSVVFDPPSIPAPGDGTSTVTVTTNGSIFPMTYSGLGILGSGGTDSEATRFTVEIMCDPPMILSLNNPKTQTVKKGSSVTLHVKAERNGPFTYQWYSGHTGLTGSPIPNSNSPDYQTPAINFLQEFWVRVTNPCGTADSNSAMIIPTN
jgi:hypothetical protein